MTYTFKLTDKNTNGPMVKRLAAPTAASLAARKILGLPTGSEERRMQTQGTDAGRGA